MEMRHTSRLTCGSIYLQQTVKLTTATARNHICAKTYGYRTYEIPTRRRMHIKAGYKQHETETPHSRATERWRNETRKPRRGEEDRETQVRKQSGTQTKNH